MGGYADPFHYVQELAEWVVNAGIDEVMEPLTGWGGAEMELARVHVNGRFKHKRFWHRDARVDQTEESIQVNMYLKAESGFRIMPAGEKYSRADLPFGDQAQAEKCTDDLEGQFIASTEVGDLFIFKSYLLHQPYSTRPRMHLHLRFNRANEYDKTAWRNYRHTDYTQYDPKAATPRERWREFVNYLRPSNKKQSNLYL